MLNFSTVFVFNVKLFIIDDYTLLKCLYIFQIKVVLIRQIGFSLYGDQYAVVFFFNCRINSQQIIMRTFAQMGPVAQEGL